MYTCVDSDKLLKVKGGPVELHHNQAETEYAPLSKSYKALQDPKGLQRTWEDPFFRLIS